MKYVYVQCANEQFVKCPKFIIYSSDLLRRNINKIAFENLESINLALFQFIQDNDETTIETIDFHVMEIDMFKIYMEQFINTNTFYNYFQNKALNKLLVCYDDQLRLKNINILKTCKEIEFWQSWNNCLINENKKYMKRDITDKTYCRITNKEGIDIGKSDTTDYISYMEQRFNNVDLFTSKFYTFRDKELTKDIVTEVVCNMHTTECYYLIMTLLISKSHCHLIANNKDVLLHFIKNNLYKKYYHAFRYALSYAWLSFYKEEQYKGRNLDITNECVFDINVASLLPIMPTNYDKVEGPLYAISPYAPILLDSTFKHSKSINGVFKSLRNGYEYGVASLSTFKERMNLFISGKNIDIFENVDWSNIGITGSIISCCLPNYNPLQQIVDDNYFEYANLYYGDSDVDIAFNGTNEECYDTMIKLKNTLMNNIEKYKEQLIKFSDEIKYNLTEYSFNEKITESNTNYNEEDDDYVIEPNIPKFRNHVLQINSKSDTVQVHVIKNANLYINKAFIIRHFIHIEEELSTTEYNNIVEQKFNEIRDDMHNINNYEQHDIRDYMYDLYVSHQQGEGKFNKDYILISVPANKEDIRMFYSEGETDFQCIETIKYKFTSQYFRVPMELFKIRTKTIMGTVSQFHFSCVRAYYANNNVYMTSSCVGACHTLICTDYKFFAGVRDPVIIWLKYLKRGYSFTFNTNELKKFIGFMKNNKEYVNNMGFTEEPETYMDWINIESPAIFGSNQSTIFSPEITYEDKIKELYNVKINNNIKKTIINSSGNAILVDMDYISYLLFTH